jgi:hypothetical protein
MPVQSLVQLFASKFFRQLEEFDISGTPSLDDEALSVLLKNA